MPPHPSTQARHRGLSARLPHHRSLAPGLGLDDADLDALFIAASQIIA